MTEKSDAFKNATDEIVALIGEDAKDKVVKIDGILLRLAMYEFERGIVIGRKTINVDEVEGEK